MFNHILNSQTKTVTFAALLLALSGLISRILGLVRDRLLAERFGAGEELDIYFAAFRIPDFVYGILIMGGISAVFLPVFSEYFRKNPKEGWELSNNVLNCFLFLLILVCGILAIFTPFFIKFIVPGFNPEQKSLAISLTRIMFLSPIFFGLSSVFSGVLHYFNRFFAYSLAPILYNLGIIFGILVFLPIFGLWGLAYGVILGAFSYWIIQVPAAKNSGFKYLPVFNFKNTGLIKIFKLTLPRIIGSSAYHINLIVITAIASTLATGSISIFNFSNNLQYFPIGIIGSSFALASFPALSRAWANGIRKEFLNNFSLTFRQILFLIIPISVLMLILRAQIVRIIFGTGQFGWWETRLTAASLGIFCFGIFAFTLIPFLARVFYSFQDTKTPTICGLTFMVLNIILSFFFVWLFSFQNIFQEFMVNVLKLHAIKEIAVIGLPLAFSLSGIFHFSLLLIFLRRKLADLGLKAIFSSFQKIFLASVLMAVFTYLTLQIVANFVRMETFLGILFQTIVAGLVGIFIYILVTHLLKSPEIKPVWSLILTNLPKSLGGSKKQ